MYGACIPWLIFFNSTSVSHCYDSLIRYVLIMATLYRVKINWTGFIGAPGFTNLYFRDPVDDIGSDAKAEAAIDKVDAFLNTTNNVFPPAVTRGVDPVVDLFQDTSGELIGSRNGSPEPPAAGGAAGSAYSAPVGAVVNWLTGGIRNGRRVRGRMFLVPLAASQFDATGTILDTSLTLLRTNAALLHANDGIVPFLHVFARPTAPGVDDGDSFRVTASSVPDKAAVLRSRRD